MAGTIHQRDSLATCWPPHSIFTATGGLRCAESRVYKRDPALPGFGSVRRRWHAPTLTRCPPTPADRSEHGQNVKADCSSVSID